MSRNDLLETTEDEFLRAVSDVTRVHGRRHVIDAILSDSNPGSSQFGDYPVENHVPDVDDSDSSDDDSDQNDNSDDDDDNDSVDGPPELNDDRIILHGEIMHNHHHCPPFADIVA
jgi:hypothetical protein